MSIGTGDAPFFNDTGDVSQIANAGLPAEGSIGAVCRGC